MQLLTRLLLAVSLIGGLVPVVAVAAPDTFEQMWPWSDQAVSDDSALLARAERELPQQAGENRSVRTASNVTCAPPGCEAQSQGNGKGKAKKADVDATSTTEKAKSIGDGTTTSVDGETTTSTAETTSTTAGKATTTTEAATTTSKPAEPPLTDGTVTGSACPCTVTGTVELKGNVSLQGDLVVKGGTLVARPGVDVDGNGFQIMFMNGGKADFQGTKVFTWSDRGAKQNLKRDINFKNLRRIMWMGGGPSVLKYFTVSDSGTPTLGDYPLHWHLNGDKTRGTIVEGVVVVNGANHAYVPHGSHGITFKDIIAKNIRGDAFWWDPPGTNESCSFQKFCTLDNSNDTKVDHALVDGVDAGSGERGFRVTGFLLGAGSGNSIRDSVAINVEPGHIKDCSGFHWPESANGNTGGNIWSFVNNFSSNPSGCHGIFVWQNGGGTHVIEGFSGGGIDHGAYKNSYEYRNVDVPYMEVHAAGTRVTGGSIGKVSTHSHRSDLTPTAEFTNTSIDRFVIRNGDGEHPGHYVLNGTGLMCSDIEHEDALPGTTVVIDGTEC